MAGRRVTGIWVLDRPQRWGAHLVAGIAPAERRPVCAVHALLPSYCQHGRMAAKEGPLENLTFAVLAIAGGSMCASLVSRAIRTQPGTAFEKRSPGY